MNSTAAIATAFLTLGWCMNLPAQQYELRPRAAEPQLVANGTPDRGDLKRLKTGKWIVRSVQRDGERNPAQVGQEVGDIITLEQKNNVAPAIFG